MKATTTANLRVRQGPSTDTVTLGVVPQGKEVEVISVASNWAKVDLLAGGQPMIELGGTARVVGYMSAAYLRFGETQPPVVVTGAPWIGINTTRFADAALYWAERGCRSFLIIDNEIACRQIKQAHPEAVVVARRWMADWQLNGKELANKVGGEDDGVIYELFNEADQWGYGTVEQIRIRIDHELEATRILRAKGVKVCMGGYSMGTPQMENPDIAAQVRRYTEFYNNDSGVYFSMHLYSPNLNHPPDYWYERRYEWLFTNCGFDARLRKVIATEDGLDDGGIGGYPTHNATSADFERITTAQQSAHMQPIKVNGVSYPSPLIARMLYCATQYQDPKWSRGFEVTPWLGWVQARGWK